MTEKDEAVTEHQPEDSAPGDPDGECGESAAEPENTDVLHRIILSVWGVQSLAVRGETFTVKIGAKCTAGCSMAGLPVTVWDENREQAAAGNIGGEIWPQTKAVYWAEVEMRAPEDTGAHTWFVDCGAGYFEREHETDPVTFGFRVSPPLDSEVTIKVVDQYNKKPIVKANIMLGLQRAVTDESGLVKLKTAGGEQKVYAEKEDYRLHEAVADITGNTEITIEMVYAPLM